MGDISKICVFGNLHRKYTLPENSLTKRQFPDVKDLVAIIQTGYFIG